MIKTITDNCSSFLKESNGTPILRNLPKNYNGFKKVKVRKQKIRNHLDAIYNSAFDYYDNIKQRCVIVHTLNNLPCPEENAEPFYIFPIDGYKFIFSQNVQNSNKMYFDMYKKLNQDIGNKSTENIMKDVLKYDYNDNDKDMSFALKNDCEIIIYGIPYFFAIRKSIVEDYYKLIYN
jgi:hypothetical protein